MSMNVADDVLRRQLDRLGQFAQATSSAIIITDAAGVITWVNAGFTRVSGYGIEEAVGLKPARLLQGPDTDRGETARIGAALRVPQSVAAELINYAKDGHRYWIGLKIEPLFDVNGELDGFMAIQADITGRHEEREAVRQLTRRFDIATRGARIGVFERDASFEILWWSDMMCEMFGQDPAVFRPSNEAWLRLIHPEDQQRIRDEVARLSRNLTSVKLQYRIIRNGEIRHLQSIGAPADAAEGMAQRIGGIVIDVTEQMQAAERERALQHQLRASSHQAGMAEIATGVLHNVGNVLNSVGTANTTARRELKNLRIDQLGEAASLLHLHREQLAAFLLNDERGRHLPDYLRSLAAHLSTQARAILAELETTGELLQHLNNIVSAQQSLARGGGVRESLHLHELVETALLVQASELMQLEVVREYRELPVVVTDRHKLLQIMVNLISNARDAIEAGAGASRILVKLAIDGSHAQLTIEDSGIGMSEEVLARLWHFGFTTKKDGHGFGLHSSAIAAQEIGATLTAHSNGIGQGSRFVLRIPLESAAPHDAAVLEQIPGHRGSHRRSGSSGTRRRA
jgi:PAS domain S-box-containing protein